MPLLDVDLLMQQLLVRAALAAGDGAPMWETGGDLDVDSFDDVPFVTHSSVIAQNGNGPGLWTVTLSLSAFLESATAQPVLDALYDAVHGWGEPPFGVIDHVGGVNEVEDQQAFSAISGEVPIKTKLIRHYVGQFALVVRYMPPAP